jgi:hypothetical protein
MRKRKELEEANINKRGEGGSGKNIKNQTA